MTRLKNIRVSFCPGAVVWDVQTHFEIAEYCIGSSIGLRENS
jgi:hypothetical protein